MKRRKWTPPHPCATCGEPAYGRQCRRCYARSTAAQPRRKALSGSWSERKRRAAVVAAWRRDVGDVCPGYQRPAHNALDLCADHVTPVAAGGDEHGELQILCRACNSSKRDRAATPMAGGGTPSRQWG